jgi:hypothetical protein
VKICIVIVELDVTEVCLFSVGGIYDVGLFVFMFETGEMMSYWCDNQRRVE